MKTIILLLGLFAAGIASAQNTPALVKKAYFTNFSDSIVKVSATENNRESSSLEPPINKGFGFGVSLGYNRISDELYDVTLSPNDNLVRVSKLPKTSFLLSTTVSAPVWRLGRNKNSKKEIDYSRKVFDTYVDGKKTGPSYFIPYGLYVVATVNLLNFNEAANGSVFNKKIDGGLGVGYRVNDDVLIALTYEMISVRQPRDFLINELNGQQIKINNEVVTKLDKNDDSFFTDKYFQAISLKLIYQIRASKVKED